jgi:hypothetical protein
VTFGRSRRLDNRLDNQRARARVLPEEHSKCATDPTLSKRSLDAAPGTQGDGSNLVVLPGPMDSASAVESTPVGETVQAPQASQQHDATVTPGS